MATQTISNHTGRIAGGRFAQTLLAHLEEVEEQGAGVNAGPNQKKAIALLHALAAEVNGQAVDSLILGRLILCQRHTTGGDDFRPGPHQRRFLSQLGRSEATPGGPALLDELEYCAVQDLIGVKDARIALAQERVAEETRQTVRTKFEAEVTRAQKSEGRAREKLAVLEARVKELSGQNEFLRGVLDDGQGPPEPAKRMRRKHFDEDPPGIFRSRLADGSTVYEVKHGKHPWQAVGPDRDAAIERLAELTGETPEPEPKESKPKKSPPKKSKPPGPTGNLRPEEVGIS